MSSDVVALVRNQPDIRTVVDGMIAFGEEIELLEVDGGAHLHDPQGRLVVAIEAPVLVEVAGEIERLLHVPVEAPIWWVDVRASATVPDAERIARKFAGDLVHWQGGTVWSGA